MAYEMFLERLNPDNKELITLHEKGEIIGFSLLEGNTILLLCVLTPYQRRGYGSKLLKESQQKILEAGFHKIVLGSGTDYLYPGVPYSNACTSNRFFEKYGYQSEWISADLLLDLKQLEESKLIKEYPDTISFRYAVPEDSAKLLEAVTEVDPDWIEYFNDSDDPVLLAMENDTIIGFEFVSIGNHPYTDPEGKVVGGIACVGIIPEARSRGVGLVLVAKGTLELAKQGCDISFIGFTHLKDWYGKLGYKVLGEYWMGYLDIGTY